MRHLCQILCLRHVRISREVGHGEGGWELERGIPTREKLVELGLADIAEDLEKAGIL